MTIDINELRKDKRPQSSTVVHALLDRLEAAESECLEQARLNGMGSEREAALLAKLGAAEKSDAESLAMYRKARDARDALRVEIEELHVLIAAVKKQADAEFRIRVKKEEEYARLCAKVEQMERQKPIGTAFLCVRCSTPFDGDHYCPECGHHTATEESVYAIPGAQPAPSASEDGLPDRDSARSAEQQGLFRKFIVRRTDGSDAPGGKHYGCRYFVLDVDHDKHAVAALTAYAKACETTHPELAKDLRGKWGAQPAPSIPDDVMRDAKRYRFLRAAKNIPISTEAARDPIAYDAAIDAAMLAAAPEASRAP